MTLSRHELEREMTRFGVAAAQVQRDHAISHILAALSDTAADRLIFFGGTALSRTYLTDARLSEDIDLIAHGPRQEVVDLVRSATSRALLRAHGRVRWTPDFSQNAVEPAIATTPDGVRIRIQVLRADGYPTWPALSTELEQRYSDVGPARLVVPTADSFAGWKTSAWFDRHAARDLYDLWALATTGQINARAAQLFAEHGPTGGHPQPFMFTTAPTDQEWTSQLAAQTRLHIAAPAALLAVRQAWAAACRDL